MRRCPSPVRRIIARALLCFAGAWVGAAWADEHALILWIGQYADPRVRIVGLERDAALARDMAQALGVPNANITERSNAQLTHAGLKDALADLRARVHPGDGVFLYFSGHGRQLQRISGGPGCSEGLATFEGGIYFDLLLRGELDALAQRASRVVMFNDSCFSGGAVTKSFSLSPAEDAAPKIYPASNEAAEQPDDLPLQAKGWSETSAKGNEAANAAASPACGVHANPVSKAFGGLAQSPRQHGVLYLAGASANEAAYPTPQGSVATRAWAACLQSREADANQDGVLTAAELRQCAQSWLQRNTRYHQTITLVGNSQVPLRRY